MRFSCISEPQRNETSLFTSILPSQMTWPPGRTASVVLRKADALPADSITTSTPRPAVSRFPAAITSSVEAFTPCVAPIRAAADHHHAVTVRDRAQIECCACTSHHAAADQTSAVERDLSGNRNSLLIRDDAIFTETSQDHQLLQIAPVD